MRPHVSSMAGDESYPVPVTVMPRSCAAAISIEPFRGPVEAISLSRGNLSRTSRGKGVRSRMTETTSNGRSRDNGIWTRHVVAKDNDLRLLSDSRPVRHGKRDSLVVVEDRNFHEWMSLTGEPPTSPEVG
jgi:hypothetical protein